MRYLARHIASQPRTWDAPLTRRDAELGGQEGPHDGLHALLQQAEQRAGLRGSLQVCLLLRVGIQIQAFYGADSKGLLVAVWGNVQYDSRKKR